MTEDGVLDKRIDGAQAYEEGTTEGGGLVAATGDKVVRVFALESAIRGHCEKTLSTTDEDLRDGKEALKFYMFLHEGCRFVSSATPAQLKIRIA